MNPIKLIRKLGKVLHGGATFRDMFLGVFLGLAVGMIPGVNLTLVILVLLLLLLNTNGALAFLSIVLGKLLCLALAPVTFHIGYAMVHNLGMVGLVRAAADTPVVALLDLHVYCLLGSLPLIVVIGVLAGWLVARSVIKMRSGIAAAMQDRQKLQKVAENKFTKLVMRVVFGKQKEALADMAGKKSPLIRKGRVLAALVVIAVLIVLQVVFLDTLVKGGLEKSIAAANGAEVNIDTASLSTGSGRLVIEGLQVTDVDRPTHNLVQAERIVADVDLRDLLTRRFVMDLVECQAMRMDVERKTPGKVYRKPKQPEKESTSILEGLKGKLGKSGEYYAEIKKFNERLKKLQEYLKSDDPKAQPDDADRLARRAKAMGYLRLSAKGYLTGSPTWVIREIKVSQIALRPSLPTFIVEGKNLSSHPSLHPEEMELSAKPDKDALKAFGAKPAKQKTVKPAGEQAEKKGLLKGLLNK
ncbi:MAG: hypothetical protein SVT52_03205 [Planctomycetota bacterium]|nr:hypothetical protein [Planctomycetota bacterium]